MDTSKMIPNISDACQKLAELEPEKFRHEHRSGAFWIPNTNYGCWPDTCDADVLTQDSIDAILSEIGMAVYVGLDLPDKPVNSTILCCTIYTFGNCQTRRARQRIWREKTDIQTTDQQAQHNAKIIGFCKAVDLYAQSKEVKL